MEIRSKISLILGKKNLFKYKFFLLANILNFFLEFISLLSIPIFVSSIISKNNLLEKINIFLNKLNIENNFIFSENLVFLSALLIIISFYVKNIFLGFILYNEKKFFKNFRLDLTKYFFNYHIEMPYLLHIKKNPSELVRSTMHDVKNAASFLEHFSILCRDIISLIVIFSISLGVNFLNTLLISFIFLIFSSSYFYFVKPLIKRKAATNQALENNIIKLLYETYSSIKDIKILSKENDVKINFNNKVATYEKNRFFFDINNRFPRIVMEISAITLIILISTYYYFIYQNTDNLFNILSVYVVLIVRFIPAFNSLTLSYGFLKMFTPSINFLSNELKNIKETKNIDEQKTEKFSITDEAEEKFLKIENLSFKYPGTEKFTLKDVSFAFNKGDVVGLMGSTGSGKTTLFHLILGLLKPTYGKVLFKGNNIIKNLKDWRKEIGYISQDVFLIDSSIKENITFNEEDKTNKLLLSKAVEISQLENKIITLPQGLNTRVGVHGLELSGGERQRIAIARTLYKNPNIIFLDEFTSALDSITEEKILNLLLKNKKNKTIIIISHRPSTLKYCNVKFFLENGQIKKLK